MLVRERLEKLGIIASASAYSECRQEFHTNHLQLVLPEFLLPGLVEKGKVAHMVHKHISQKRQLRISRCDLAGIRSEGSTESLQGGG